MTTGQDKPEGTKLPYYIEEDERGCPHCDNGRLWSVVGPDGIALGRTWDNAQDAEDLALLLSDAHERGAASAKSSSSLARSEKCGRCGKTDEGGCMEIPCPLGARTSMREMEQQLRDWYAAASPYATPTALKEALASATTPAATAMPDSPLPSNGAIAHNYAKLMAALAELLRLYDWRNELGRIERDFNHDRKQMKTWLNQYGREKKQAWAIARDALAGAPVIDVLMLHERIQCEAQSRLASSASACKISDSNAPSPVASAGRPSGVYAEDGSSIVGARAHPSSAPPTTAPTDEEIRQAIYGYEGALAEDAGDEETVAPARAALLDVMRRCRDTSSATPRGEGSDGAQALALLYLLAETAPIMRWKEYEDRGEERIPCFIAVETAKEIAAFFPRPVDKDKA